MTGCDLCFCSEFSYGKGIGRERIASGILVARREDDNVEAGRRDTDEEERLIIRDTC